MPIGLRFCRNCGFRLGEGPAEYTETVRFQNGHRAAAAAAATSPHQPLVTSYSLGNSPMTVPSGKVRACGRKISGMTWIFLGLLLFFLAAGAFTALFTPARRAFPAGVVSTSIAPPRSYFGVNGFESTDGGLTFGNVEPPGSPADKAGLVGGDIVTSFDGQQLEDTDQVADLLRSTPIGKTVDVTYIRDGETKTTKLTTISREDSDRLAADFRSRPEGQGYFGFQQEQTQRVAVPNSKIYGVKMGTIRRSEPADIAGVKKDDIVIKFGEIPIRTRAELVSRIRRALPYSTVDVTVIRDGQEMTIPVKLGKQ